MNKPTMGDIAKKAEEVFHDIYTVHDILNGNTIEMHREAWDIARDTLIHMWRLENESRNNIQK